jgi:L-ascorbate metabolism protein UlaG (beta-lactamase superfamily)
MDGARLLTDPLLRRRVGHLLRAGMVPAIGDIDAVLISHAHHDHLDLVSIARVAPEVPIVVPRGIARVVKSRARVIETTEGEEIEFGSVTVRATHAVHEGRRAGGRAEGPALGYAITGSKRVYFAGDTALFPEMDGLVTDLDVALIPIWGWGPSLGRGLHLDPGGAAEALRLLKPRVAIPIHWGTYRPFIHRSRAGFLSRPAVAFAEAAAELAPEVDVRILQPGESYSFDAPTAPRSGTPRA